MEILDHAIRKMRQSKKDEQEGGNGKGAESATRTGMRRRRHCSRDGGSSLLLGDADDDAAVLALGVLVCRWLVACGRSRGGASAARSLCGGVGYVWVR